MYERIHHDNKSLPQECKDGLTLESLVPIHSPKIRETIQ